MVSILLMKSKTFLAVLNYAVTPKIEFLILNTLEAFEKLSFILQPLEIFTVFCSKVSGLFSTRTTKHFVGSAVGVQENIRLL